MAEGFKIADAFVEIHAEIDRTRVRKAGETAGEHVGDGLGDGVRKRRGGLAGTLSSVLGSLGDVVSGVGGKLGGKLTSGLTDIAPGLAQGLSRALANPYVLAGVAASAAIVGSVVVSAIGGAILAGLGTGVIGAGIALALQDPDIRESADMLGEDIYQAVRGAASQLNAPFLSALKLIRDGFRQFFIGDLRAIFYSASKLIDPLTRALLGLVRGALPGIRDAVENLEPVFAVIGRELPELGTQIGNLFTTLGRNSETFAKALELAFDLIQVGITALTGAFEASAFVFEAWLKVAPIGMLIDLGLAADTTTKAYHKYTGQTEELAKATASAEAHSRSLVDAMAAVANQATTSLDAELNYKDALDGVSNAIKNQNAELSVTNGILDLNTPKQRAGAEAINEVAKSALARAKAERDSKLATEGQIAADAAFRASLAKSREDLIKQAQKLGLTAKEAKTLADNLLGIPKHVKSTVDVYIKVTGGKQLAGDNPVGSHAYGGMIRGPGTATSDSIPAMLSDGEFVMRASAVKRIGKQNLEAMNEGRSPSTPFAQDAPQTTATAVMDRPPAIINLNNPSFYGVGTADQFVADMYDSLDRYERRHR